MTNQSVRWREDPGHVGSTQQKGKDWRLIQQLGCSEQERVKHLTQGKETQMEETEVKPRGLPPDNPPNSGLVGCRLPREKPFK